MNNQTWEGVNLLIPQGTTLTLSSTSTLHLYQDAQERPSLLLIYGTLIAPEGTTIQCEGGSEIIAAKLGGTFVQQAGAVIEMDCLNACMAARNGGTLRFEAGGRRPSRTVPSWRTRGAR